MIVVVTGICVASANCRKFLARVAGDDAAADIKHRAFGLLDQADDFVQAKSLARLGPDCSRATLISFGKTGWASAC